MLLRAGVAPKFDLKVLNSGNMTNRSEQFAGFQSDAPSCDNCGIDLRASRQLLPLPQLRRQPRLFVGRGS